jgi:hypothetical protein
VSGLKKSDKKRLQKRSSRHLYDAFARGVRYLLVIDSNGDHHIGTCFHIGDGVFITARHVVENCQIKALGGISHKTLYFGAKQTEIDRSLIKERFDDLWKASTFKGPYFHPDDKIDIAAFVVADIDLPILPLGGHLDDWLDHYFILTSLVIFGYPPIPFSIEPTLIVSKCEVNAIIDKYTGGHPYFIVSAMARGGFSGGPAISEDGYVLGVITESLIVENQPAELGYLAVLSVEGIYVCISHHRIVPKHIDEEWDGFWNTENSMFSGHISHFSVDIYRGNNRYYLKISCMDTITILTNSLKVIDDLFCNFYAVTWIHDTMIKIEFKDGSINEAVANQLYQSIINMIQAAGFKKIS